MRYRMSSIPMILLMLSASPTLAQAQATGDASGARAQMAVVPVTEAINRDFQPLYPDRPEGPNLVILEGDPKSGPSLTLFRYGRDYTGSGNLHFHTHDYRLWLIEGVLKHWDEDGREATATRLEPGAYVYQPANLLHAANCLTDRCIAYVAFDGPIETGLPAGK